MNIVFYPMGKCAKSAILIMLMFLAVDIYAHPFDMSPQAYKIGEKIDFDCLECIDGKKIDIKNSLGKKPIIIFAWSYYYDNCAESVSNIIKLYKEYKKKATFIAVSLDSDKKKIDKIVSNKNFEFENTYNPFITFPPKLLGAFTKDKNMILIVDKDGAVSRAWEFSNDQDYQDMKTFLDKYK